jgi:hypothetical protein
MGDCYFHGCDQLRTEFMKTVHEFFTNSRMDGAIFVHSWFYSWMVLRFAGVMSLFEDPWWIRFFRTDLRLCLMRIKQSEKPIPCRSGPIYPPDILRSGCPPVDYGPGHDHRVEQIEKIVNNAKSALGTGNSQIGNVVIAAFSDSKTLIDVLMKKIEEAIKKSSL